MKNFIYAIGEMLMYGLVIISVMLILWFFISLFDVAAHNLAPGCATWLRSFNFFDFYLRDWSFI